jgi:hypothetical protein
MTSEQGKQRPLATFENPYEPPFLGTKLGMKTINTLAT